MTQQTNDAVNNALHRLQRTVRTQTAVIVCITSLTEFLMANNDDLNAALDETDKAVEADEAADDTKIATDAATIADLNAQIAALEAGQDTQPIIDRLKVIQSKLHAPAA